MHPRYPADGLSMPAERVPTAAADAGAKYLFFHVFPVQRRRLSALPATEPDAIRR